jgi:acyl-CoA dehydrogenase
MTDVTGTDVTGTGVIGTGVIGTNEIAAAVGDLLASLKVYGADGSWSEEAERAACGRLADGGWLGVGQPETLGGSGGSVADAAAVTAACAATGHRLPAADTGFIAGHVLEVAGLRAPSGPPEPGRPPTPGGPPGPGERLAPDGLLVPVPEAGVMTGGRVTVRCARVPFARWATGLLIVATGDGGARACIVRAADAQIGPGRNLGGEPRDSVTVDGARPADVSDSCGDLVAQLRRAGALARAIQISAAISQMLELTVRYCGQRQQFGRRLSQFQAVQQQLAVLAGEELAARAAVQRALTLTGPGSAWPAEPVAVAKVRTALAATAAARIAHQLHGAIGITTEYPLSRFTRPAWAWRDEYGSEHHWSGVLARESGPDLWETLTSAG